MNAEKLNHNAPKDRATHEAQHPLKAIEENVVGEKPNISQEIKAEENEKVKEKDNHIEELSLWEKILLGLRCARQDCQGLY